MPCARGGDLRGERLGEEEWPYDVRRNLALQVINSKLERPNRCGRVVD
jgi:hypothetical protein